VPNAPDNLELSNGGEEDAIFDAKLRAVDGKEVTADASDYS
jgi:hypothetical protein